MEALFFNIYFVLLMATLGLLFSIMAHSRKSKTFFYLGIGALVLVTIYLIADISYLSYAILAGGIFFIVILAAYITSIVFLILHLTGGSNNSNIESAVTDVFLDEIIEGEEEDWDAES
jgi:hypothetical protein